MVASFVSSQKVFFKYGYGLALNAAYAFTALL